MKFLLNLDSKVTNAINLGQGGLNGPIFPSVHSLKHLEILIKSGEDPITSLQKIVGEFTKEDTHPNMVVHIRKATLTNNAS